MSEKMPDLLMFKALKTTRHFNAGQKLWVVYTTGNMAVCVKGKFRGRGRYVEAWYRYGSKKDVIPEFKTIPVTEEFYNRVMGENEQAS